MRSVFREVDVLALPTLGFFPPEINDDVEKYCYTDLTIPVNFADLPAVALPVPTEARLPASLQLVGQAHAEEMLLGLAHRVESAVR